MGTEQDSDSEGGDETADGADEAQERMTSIAAILLVRVVFAVFVAVASPRFYDAGAVGAAVAVAGAVFLIAAAVAAVVVAVAGVEIVDALLVAASVHRRKPALNAVTVGLIRRVRAITMTIANLINRYAMSRLALKFRSHVASCTFPPAIGRRHAE